MSSRKEVTKDSITLHGRGGFHQRFTLFAGQTQLDISGSTMFFEVSWETDAGEQEGFRKPLVTHATDAKALAIVLTRSDVEALPQDRINQFAVVDETGQIPLTRWSGIIIVVGYKGDPSD